MSNVRLKKLTVMGHLDEKAEIVKNLQNLGSLHVIPLTESEKQLTSRPEEYIEALRYLILCPEHRTAFTDRARFDPDMVVRQTLQLKEIERRLKNRRDKLQRYIRKIRDWGFFELPEPDKIGGYDFFYYKVPLYMRGQLARLQDEGLAFQEIYRGNLNSYIVIISRDKPEDGRIPGKETKFKGQSLRSALNELEDIKVKLEDLSDERCRLTRFISLLLRNLDREEDEAIYEYYMDRTLDADGYFAIQGWLPEDKLEEIATLQEQHDLAVYLEEPAEGDKPPTLFTNKTSVEPGEDLIRFYQMPAYNAWDPSSVVYLSFALFFAMIMSDAGYALLMFGLLGLFWNKLSRNPLGLRMRRMGVLFSGVSFIYGILAGSYFGVEPGKDTLLGMIDIIDVNNFEKMMVLSVCIGVLHLMLANLIMAWNNRESVHCFSYLGWIAVFFAGTGLWLAGADEFVFQVMLGLGILMVFLFTSRRPFDNTRNFAMRIVDGLLGITNLSKAFGDTLSYMRLFALGLATASLAVMFNTLAGQVEANIAGVGTLLAILVLIMGHTLNFLLAVMGGVVHGLRLNLIEFFSWSLNDEGYAFEPFQIKEKELWVTQ